MKKFMALFGAMSLLALTACGRMDSAATIGDVTVTQAQTQGVIDEILNERSKVDTTGLQLPTGQDLNRGELRFTIVTILFEKIARELKIEVTPSEIQQRRADLISQIGGEERLPQALAKVNIAPSNFEKYIKVVITSEKISKALQESGVVQDEVGNRIGQLISAKAKQLNVTINPRYGAWDFQQGDIVAKDSAGSAVVPSSK